MTNQGENLNRAALSFLGFNGADVARFNGLNILQKLYIAGLGLHQAKLENVELEGDPHNPFNEMLFARRRAKLRICSSGFLQVANEFVAQPVVLKGKTRTLMHKSRFYPNVGYLDDWSPSEFGFTGKTELVVHGIEDRSDNPLFEADGYPIHYFGRITMNCSELFIPIDVNPETSKLLWSKDL